MGRDRFWFQPDGYVNLMSLQVLLAQTDTEPVEDTFEELSRLTPSDWLVAGSLVVASIVIGLIVRALVVRAIRGRAGHLISALIGRLIVAGFVAVGLVYALNQIGVSIGPLLGLLGLFGFAMALAFQDILANFIAGVMISVQRPFRVGDEVSTAGFEGVVEDVSLRSVTLRSFDGVRVIVPNATVWDGPIETFTALGSRRTDLSLGVAYDSDLDEAQRLIVETVKSVDGVADEPAPAALVHEFADSSINFSVRFWHDPDVASEWHVRDRIARLLKRRLDDAGVEIPFPQLVLHRSEE